MKLARDRTLVEFVKRLLHEHVTLGQFICMDSMRKKTRRVSIRAAALAALAACTAEDAVRPGVPYVPPAGQGLVARVKVTPDSTGLVPGTATILRAMAYDNRGLPFPPRAAAWGSSDTTLATVTQTGIVVARRAGMPTIRAVIDRHAGFAIVVIAAPVQP